MLARHPFCERIHYLQRANAQATNIHIRIKQTEEKTHSFTVSLSSSESLGANLAPAGGSNLTPAGTTGMVRSIARVTYCI